MIIKVIHSTFGLVGKLLAQLVIGMIKIYKIAISPILPNSCRFEPTCSSYCIAALKKHGFYIGLIKSIWRILRCNPFSKGGYDPV